MVKSKLAGMFRPSPQERKAGTRDRASQLLFTPDRHFFEEAMEDDISSFECYGCGARFSAALFEIARELGRVDFASEIPTIHIQDTDVLSAFCSFKCRASSRRPVMDREGVPIRPVDASDPIAPCAKCGRPVDMTKFHVSYTEYGFKVITPQILQPIDFACLAVLCLNCGPDRTTLNVSVSTQCA